MGTRKRLLVLSAGMLGLRQIPPAHAQRMACETTVVTTTTYYSNGIVVTWKDAVTVCWPIAE